jgi:hypothetical protein
MSANRRDEGTCRTLTSPRELNVLGRIVGQVNVLGPLMMNRIVGQVGCTDIVTKHNGGSFRWVSQLSKDLTKPTALSHNISNTTVLGFCTRPRYSVLPFGRP